MPLKHCNLMCSIVIDYDFDLETASCLYNYGTENDALIACYLANFAMSPNTKLAALAGFPDRLRPCDPVPRRRSPPGANRVSREPGWSRPAMIRKVVSSPAPNRPIRQCAAM